MLIMLLEKIEALKGQISNLKAENEEALEALRIKYLSKKGEISELFSEFRSVPPEQKREFGQKLNELKTLATDKINTLRDSFKAKEKETHKIDITRPAMPDEIGTRHPISLVRKEIIDIFSRLGFTLSEGPEVEDDWHVFSNIILRSHTSSVQVRTMERQQPPIRIICPGRVYRNEAITARAHCFFHQIEGLYIDKHVTFADLKQVLLYFAQELFGKDTKIRLRPSYFPFTEPSAEMDVSCMLCGGKGCGFCKHTGWVEILGCGMVDPNVLKASGIDPDVYSGYAFGLGIERITNLKYMVKDLRMFSENDVRFLDEFEAAH